MRVYRPVRFVATWTGPPGRGRERPGCFDAQCGHRGGLGLHIPDALRTGSLPASNPLREGLRRVGAGASRTCSGAMPEQPSASRSAVLCDSSEPWGPGRLRDGVGRWLVGPSGVQAAGCRPPSVRAGEGTRPRPEGRAESVPEAGGLAPRRWQRRPRRPPVTTRTHPKPIASTGGYRWPAGERSAVGRPGNVRTPRKWANSPTANAAGAGGFKGGIRRGAEHPSPAPPYYTVDRLA